MDENQSEGMFDEMLAAAATASPAVPAVFYNEDGDCIEFLISTEGFYAERVDKLLTVFYGRESGEIVGSLIKGVKRFIAEMAQSGPGFAIDVQDGRVRLSHLFSAGMRKHGDRVKVRCYQKLRTLAEQLPEECVLVTR
jgi:hypothetical protein